MNGSAIVSSTEARTTRANTGVIATPIAIIACVRLAPSRPLITIASSRPGNANMMSTARMSTLSITPFA
jgi:hypothetical protein